MTGEIAEALAAFLAASPEAALRSAVVRGVDSGEELPLDVTAVIVRVEEVVHDAGPLYTASVLVTTRTPAGVSALSLAGHRATSWAVRARLSGDLQGLRAAMTERGVGFGGLYVGREQGLGPGDAAWETGLSLVLGVTAETSGGSFPDNQGTEQDFEATATLSGGRFVHLSGGSVEYADARAGMPAMGYIRSAVAAGDTVTVYRQGRLDGLVGLVLETDYYLGPDGTITATPETSDGLIQYVGRAITSTALLVEIDSALEVET